MNFNLNDTTGTFGNGSKLALKLDKRELKTPSMIGENSTNFNYSKKTEGTFMIMLDKAGHGLKLDEASKSEISETLKNIRSDNIEYP